MSLLKMSVSASVMIVLIIVAHGLLVNRISKRVFVVLWDLVLIRLLIPFSIPFQWGVFSIILNRTNVSEDIVQAWIPVSMDVVAKETVNGMAGTGVHEVASPILTEHLIWILGLFIIASCFIVTYMRSYRRFATAIPIENEAIRIWQQNHMLKRHYRILQKEGLASPLTYGIVRPVVLLPSELDWKDETQLNYILLHEFTHIRYMDSVRKMVMAIAVCIHWYNPLVWFMYVYMNYDMELACDEGVLRKLEGDNRKSYALTLIGLEEKKGYPSMSVNYFSKNRTQKRITAIMKNRKISFIGNVCATVLIALIMLCGTTAIATAAPPLETTFGGEEMFVGTWYLDGDETEKHLVQYSSLREMYGTAVGAYTAHLTIDAALEIDFSIGAVPNCTGILELQKDGTYTAKVSDEKHLLMGPLPVRVYMTETDDHRWLVMEYMGEQLYWNQGKK